jgi:hypothetical protein
MKIYKINTYFFVLAFLIMPITMIAQAPQLINYQGSLQQDGEPLTGEVNIIFSIFDAETEGTNLWIEIQSGVNVTKGVFHVLLGSVTAFPADLFNNDGERFLEVSINGNTALTPRSKFTSVAYALTAQNADQLNGFDESEFARSPILTRIHYNGSTSDNSITNTYEQLRIIGTFNKLSESSDIELTWIDHASVVGSFVEFQIRIDDKKDDGSALNSYEGVSGGSAVVFEGSSPVSVFTIFKDLPVGEHIISIWIRGVSATSCILNVGNFGHDVFVREISQVTGAPGSGTLNNQSSNNNNYIGGVEK